MPRKIDGTSDSYEIEKLVAETSEHRIYRCKQVSTNRQCLLQIVTDISKNGGLNRAAYILREMKDLSDKVEEKYAKVKTEETGMLNFDFGFPELIDSFCCLEQGKRQVNILAFRGVDEVNQMVPLSSFIRDKVLIDLRSGVWILGRLLKLLTFIHGQRISLDKITLSNVLIEPDQHHVVIFDWSESKTHEEEVPSDVRRCGISNAAQTMIAVLGGDHESGDVPNSGEEGCDQYIEYIVRLACNGERDAEIAHKKFYGLVDQIWERGYYKFTTNSIF